MDKSNDARTGSYVDVKLEEVVVLEVILEIFREEQWSILSAIMQIIRVA